MLPNLANAQLLKELKRQIKKNDVFSIQLKTRTQINVDVEMALKKVPVNAKHIYVQVCRFKSLKGFLPEPRYTREHQKGLSKTF
jgi:hypothetical protein